MERRHFLSNSSKALLLASAGAGLAGSCKPGAREKTATAAAGQVKHPGYPMAITMWDFSWLERRWMFESIELVRQKYPELDYTFSFTTEYETWETEDVSYLDLLELHIWMVQVTDFYPKTGYQYTPWGNESYRNLQLNGEKEYRSNEKYYLDKLAEHIEARAALFRASGLAIGTTECWGIIDYKDYPLLDWGWVMEIEWHKRLTDRIRQSPLDEDLLS